MELHDTWKTLKRYEKIHWFSRWQTIIIFYDLLESTLTYYKDTSAQIDENNIEYIYLKLWSFKYIYIFIFSYRYFSFIINVVSKFWHKFVDAIIMHSISKINIIQIHIYFKIEDT